MSNETRRAAADASRHRAGGACAEEGPSVDGVLVIDKPQGVTSHDVVAIARRRLRERRIGHTGTLDPLATGVLPLACGRATRLVRFLTASDKDYDATLRFGVTTDSYDITGSVTSQSDRLPTREEVETALAQLEGEYLQMPPAFSAKKVDGQRAYALARARKAVELTAVPVRVSRVRLLQWAPPAAVVALTCSAGFYVRSFAHTAGQITGAGACLEALRRTRSGQFGLAACVPLDALVADTEPAPRLIPMEGLLTDQPSVRLTVEGRERVTHGREIGMPHVDTSGQLDARAEAMLSAGARPVEADEWVRMLGPDGRLVAMATRGAAPGALHPSVVLI